MMDNQVFDNYISEYWFHVSNQNEIPIIGHAERSINSSLLHEIAHRIVDSNTDDIETLKQIITANVDSIDTLRTIVGITDKRMYLELSYIFNKKRNGSDSKRNILGESIYLLQKHSIKFFKGIIRKDDDISQKVCETIAQYFEDHGVITVLHLLGKMNVQEIKALVDYMLLPKEIQQEETKKRGHGAEQRLALLIHELGVSFIPDKRHINPMSQDDPNVSKATFELSDRDETTTWSMDLIIKDGEALRVFVQGLIHTSDPGQYGVNKSAETVLVKSRLANYNATSTKKIELWGLVDGVGFIENPKHTVFKMIEQFDTFVQLKSLYKAGLRLHKLGMVHIKAIRFNMDFYSEEEANQMFSKYGSDDIQLVTDVHDCTWKEVEAGMAWLYV